MALPEGGLRHPPLLVLCMLSPSGTPNLPLDIPWGRVWAQTCAAWSGGGPRYTGPGRSQSSGDAPEQP